MINSGAQTHQQFIASMPEHLPENPEEYTYVTNNLTGECISLRSSMQIMNS